MKERLSKADWVVRPVEISVARALVVEHHYARGASNTATYLHGLFPASGGECVGVAWWIPPTKSAAYATHPDNWKGVLNLSRLVIAPGVPQNAATFLLARSRKAINRATWPCLVTYADEWRGHTGQIYKADNWIPLGLTKPERTYVIDSRMVARKAGGNTRTHAEMLALGAECVGSFRKHKFVHLAKRRLTVAPEPFLTFKKINPNPGRPYVDIKISLEIGLSPALERFLGKLVGDWPQPKSEAQHRTEVARDPTLQDGEIGYDEEGTPIRAESQGPQPEAQRRTRRTKAQMAEDAAGTNTTSGSTDLPEAGSADAEQPASDLAAALGVEQPEARDGVTAKADVAAKMQEAMAAASPKKVQEKMIEHLNGAKNLSSLDPDLYGKAVELFDSIIAGA